MFGASVTFYRRMQFFDMRFGRVALFLFHAAFLLLSSQRQEVFGGVKKILTYL